MSLIFAGANREVLIPSSPTLENMPGLTIAGWVFPTGLANDDAICYRENAGGSSVYRLILAGSGGDLQFVVWRTGGFGFVVTNTSPLVLNQWNYVAATFEDTDTLRVFCGTLTTPLVEAGYSSNVAGSGVMIPSDGVLRVGNSISNRTTRNFDGSIALFEHYGRRLPIGELIEGQWSLGLSADANVIMPMGWFLDGTTQPDISGKGNNGIITGAVIGPGVPVNLSFGDDTDNALIPVLAEVVTGNIAVTLADAVTQATGQVGINANVAVTLADAVTQATGAVGIAAGIEVTLADATTVATGQIGASVDANVVVTLADAVTQAAGMVGINANVGVTLADAVTQATGAIGIAANVAVALADATTVATGQVGANVDANIAVTLADAVTQATGQVGINANVAVTLADAITVATGQVGDDIAATIAVTLADAVTQAAGAVGIAANVAVTLADATTVATGAVGDDINANIAVTLADAVTQATGAVGINVAVEVTLADAVTQATGAVGIAAGIEVTLADAVTQATGAVGINANVAVALADATTVATGTVSLSVVGNIVATLADAVTVAMGTVGGGGGENDPDFVVDFTDTVLGLDFKDIILIAGDGMAKQLRRVRGDTQGQSVLLQRNGVILDLDTTSKVEFAYEKDGVVVVLLCVNDVDPLTGTVTIPFTAVDVGTVGFYPFDIQVTYTDNTKSTFIVSTLEIADDVNKT